MKATLTTAAALFLFGSTTGLSAQPEGLLGGPALERGQKQAQAADRAEGEARRERGPRGGAEGHRRGRGMDKAAFLERFDTDGDGELSEAEKAGAKETIKAEREAKRAERKAVLLERFDDNDNGELDDAEREAIRELMGNEMRDRGQRGQQAKRHMHRQALEQFDADGDGELNDAERDAAKAHFKQKKEAIVEQFDADGDGTLTGDERRAAREHHREMRMLDANRDGAVDALDVQAITERAAGGERIPDINGDGAQDAADVAELLRRIGSFED